MGLFGEAHRTAEMGFLVDSPSRRKFLSGTGLGSARSLSKKPSLK
jgi:hypothetical protein